MQHVGVKLAITLCMPNKTIIFCMPNKMVCSSQNQVKTIDISDITPHFVMKGSKGKGNGMLPSDEGRLFASLDHGLEIIFQQ